MISEEKYAYQFGSFFLDPYERILKREDTQIRLRGKVFDTLLYFVQNPRRLIRSEELLDAIWADAVVEQTNIFVVIHELRRVLGEEVQIQTVSRYGYRLNIDVNRVSATQVNSEAGPQITSHPSSKGLPPSRLLQVFICHSSDDKPAVRQLCYRLRTSGIEPWLDEENLLPGQDWQQQIPKAVRSSDVVVVCLSNAAVTKRGYVQKELRYALDISDEQPEGTIFLIPLKLEDCEVPERLRRWQWVNLFEDHGYEKLMRALDVRAKELGAAHLH